MKKGLFAISLLSILTFTSCQAKIDLSLVSKYRNYFYCEWNLKFDVNNIDFIFGRYVDIDLKSGAFIEKLYSANSASNSEMNYLSNALSNARFFVGGGVDGYNTKSLAFYNNDREKLLSFKFLSYLKDYYILENNKETTVEGYFCYLDVVSSNKSFKKVKNKLDKILDDEVKESGYAFYIVFEEEEVFNHYFKMMDNAIFDM